MEFRLKFQSIEKCKCSVFTFSEEKDEPLLGDGFYCLLKPFENVVKTAQKKSAGGLET